MTKISLLEFAVRVNSSRGKLLQVLIESFGKQIPIAVLMDKAFGKKKGSTKALTNALWHIERAIVKRELPYELVKQKRTKGMTIGLYPVEDHRSQIIAAGATLAATNPKVRLTSDNE